MKCHYCQKDTILPFRCPYCGYYFCSEHRLPENHNCPELWRARAPREKLPPITVETRSPHEYTTSYTLAPPRRHKILWFSITELKHLAVGTVLVMSVAISLFLYSSFDLTLLVALALIFTASFLLHEIAHKLTAQRYGAWAEFRVNVFGVLITLISIIPHFPKLIAPGAVVIAGPMNRETVGKTASAGPLTNIVLATLFITVAFFASNTLLRLGAYGAWINAFIAFFNLIPFGLFDGLKIFRWSKPVWATSLIASLTLMILTAIRFPLL